ncbi:hypothetical protein [Amycolatopsis minnesotensis]|uniref:Uncharacterized protein n=1 Tax=Amycolatopsis minnesotensis TaxID=337894 RepID=A0ABP5BEZ1_9PSEU
MKFKVFDKYGKELEKNQQLTDFRGDVWFYESCTHPRKVNVYQGDPNGIYPEKFSGEYYPEVFDLQIVEDGAEPELVTVDWFEQATTDYRLSLHPSLLKQALTEIFENDERLQGQVTSATAAELVQIARKYARDLLDFLGENREHALRAGFESHDSGIDDIRAGL